MPTSIGLTLGKYAPLHKGHQSIIAKAVREMDLVYVMIYDSPEIIDIPLPKRASWIHRLYPTVRIIECYDHPKRDGYTPEIKRAHEDYIAGKLFRCNSPKITHFYSNEEYGEHVSKYLNAEDVRWGDKNICATMIREEPHKNRFFVHPWVYRDMIKKVCFMGAESTGKSTITREMAKRYNTSYMHEYGADYWRLNQKNMKLNLDQLQQIAINHHQIEETYMHSANRYFFADTCPITTRMFSLFYHNGSTYKLDALADLAQHQYDFYFLCDIDIPYEDTWDRSGFEHRKNFQKEIIKDLNNRRIDYILLSGDLKTRIEKVENIIGRKT